jgi:hypothetical protein
MEKPSFIPDTIKAIEALVQDTQIDLMCESLSLSPGKGLTKNQAIETTRQLKSHLKDLIRTDSAAIILQGPDDHQLAYSAIAEDEGDVVTVLANGIYRELTRLVWPFISTKRFTLDIGSVFATALYSVAKSLGVMSYMAPVVNQYVGLECPDQDTLYGMIKDSVREANGDDFAIEWVVNEVFIKVLAGSYEQNVVPVVVLGATEEDVSGNFAAKLFDGRSIVVSVKDTVEKNDIIIAFKKIKPMYKRVIGARKQ